MKFLPSLNIDVFMLQMFLDPIWLYIKQFTKSDGETSNKRLNLWNWSLKVNWASVLPTSTIL